MNCKIILLFLSVVCAVFSVSAVSPLTLARNGHAVLVTAEDASPTARFAAQELATALKRTLNVSVRIQTDKEPLPVGEVTFLVGPCRYSPLPELPYDHFVIRRRGNAVQLAGRDDGREPLANFFMARTGTLYAVYRFMRDQLGVRMLWPGEEGAIYPELKELVLPELVVTDGPALPIRNAYYGHGGRYDQQSREGLVRWGRFNGMGCSKLGSVGHASDRAVGTGYYQSHPEYYALIGGKRRKPVGNRWKLCHSNPALAGIFAEWGIGHQTAGPFVLEDFFPVSANDSSGWCECPECLKLDAGQKSAHNSDICVSGRMFTLANRTAREVKVRNSAKEVAIYAYAAYLDPPVGIPRLEGNIILFVARGIAWNAAPAEAAAFRQLFEQWSRKTDKIVLRDYRNNLIPMLIFPYPKLAHHYIQYLNEQFSGFQGVNICGDDTRAAALWGPTGYVYARMLWDPKQDLEPILTDFYRNGWPRSHSYIRRYFEYFEQRAESAIAESGQLFWPWKAGRDLLTARQIMSPEAFRTGYDLLSRAAAAATGSPAELRRIEFLKTGLDAVRIDQEYYDALMQVAAFSGSLLNIPPHPQPDPVPDKKRLLQRAEDAIRRRHDFLEQNRIHEGIPSAPLVHPQARFTSDWENTVRELLSLYSKKGDTLSVLNDGWRFRIDPDDVGVREEWFNPDLPENNWSAITTDGSWEKQGFGTDRFPATKGYNGWGWYRRTVEIPSGWQGGRILLILGAVDESFDLYVDGQLRSRFRYDAARDPDSWNKPHTIDLTPYLTPGKHQLTVAVHDRGGAGGIWKPCFIEWEKANLLPDDLAAFSTSNLKITGRELETISDSNGTLAISLPGKPGAYRASLEFESLGDRYFYKIPVALKISFKDASGKTLAARPETGLHRNNLYPGKRQRLELNFEAPPDTSRIYLRLMLRLNRLHLKTLRLEAE